MTKEKPVLDPFSRPSDLGESTNITDNSEQEANEIKQFIPEEASIDEGYAKMLEILGKEDPVKHTKKSNSRVMPSTNNAVEEPAMEFLPTEKEVEHIVNPKEPAKVEEEPAVKQGDTKKFKDEEILPLLDAILTKGYASETFYIRKAAVTLRTQFFWEDQMVLNLTDEASKNLTLKATSDFYFQVYALAANLEEFGGVYFKPTNRGTPETLRKSFMERVDFLMSLPTILVNQLYERRNKFIDKALYLNENFSSLLESF